MILFKPDLLEGREYLYFFVAWLSLLLFSLSFEYYHYKNLTQFDDAIIDVQILKQYPKSKEGKVYEVLQLQDEQTVKFYITSKEPLKNLVGHESKIWLSTRYITFLEYLKGYVTKGKVVTVSRELSLRYQLAQELNGEHKDLRVEKIYGALFFALPLPRELQERFSALGVSHLLAISGFHLGVLSLLLYLVLTPLYKWLQQRYFPYRHRNRDLFMVVALILGSYLLLLGGVASLLRAYTMMIIGFILYDRGMRVISMQTFLLTLLLLLALWPRLFFSLGFWLSISGVYFIFLYFHYFKSISKQATFVLLALWVYMMMVPISILIFSTYSLWHISSVLASMLFLLFYPIALFLHLVGLGGLLDPFLLYYIDFELEVVKFALPWQWLIAYVLLSMGAYFSRYLLYVLMAVSTGVTVAAIYEVA